MARKPETLLDPLTADQQKMVVDHMNVAYGRTRRWVKFHPQKRDEIRSMAIYALIEAVATYEDRADGWSLVGKICWRVDCRVRDMIRKSAPFGYRHGNRDSIPKTLQIDLLDEGFHPFEQEDRDDTPEINIDTLTPREREVIRLIFWEGLSQAAVGERLGVAQSVISRTYTAAIDHLKYKMAS